MSDVVAPRVAETGGGAIVPIGLHHDVHIRGRADGLHLVNVEEHGALKNARRRVLVSVLIGENRPGILLRNRGRGTQSARSVEADLHNVNALPRHIVLSPRQEVRANARDDAGEDTAARQIAPDPDLAQDAAAIGGEAAHHVAGNALRRGRESLVADDAAGADVAIMRDYVQVVSSRWIVRSDIVGRDVASDLEPSRPG